MTALEDELPITADPHLQTAVQAATIAGTVVGLLGSTVLAVAVLTGGPLAGDRLIHIAALIGVLLAGQAVVGISVMIRHQAAMERRLTLRLNLRAARTDTVIDRAAGDADGRLDRIEEMLERVCHVQEVQARILGDVLEDEVGRARRLRA